MMYSEPGVRPSPVAARVLGVWANTMYRESGVHDGKQSALPPAGSLADSDAPRWMTCVAPNVSRAVTGSTARSPPVNIAVLVQPTTFAISAIERPSGDQYGCA